MELKDYITLSVSKCTRNPKCTDFDVKLKQ